MFSTGTKHILYGGTGTTCIGGLKPRTTKPYVKILRIQPKVHQFLQNHIIMMDSMFILYQLGFDPHNFNNSRVRMSHPNSRSDPIGGSEPGSGRETIYWDSLPDFFFFYNRIKISHTYQKNYHRSGVHQNLYTYTKSHLQI